MQQGSSVTVPCLQFVEKGRRLSRLHFSSERSEKFFRNLLWRAPLELELQSPFLFAISLWQPIAHGGGQRASKTLSAMCRVSLMQRRSSSCLQQSTAPTTCCKSCPRSCSSPLSLTTNGKTWWVGRTTDVEVTAARLGTDGSTYFSRLILVVEDSVVAE
jgi:hypothetical protein